MKHKNKAIRSVRLGLVICRFINFLSEKKYVGTILLEKMRFYAMMEKVRLNFADSGLRVYAILSA